MKPKYAVQKLQGGWVVIMASNGRIIAERFETEEAASLVREEFESGRRTVDKKMDVWVIADTFVCEPYVGGTQIGEAGTLDMR